MVRSGCIVERSLINVPKLAGGSESQGARRWLGVAIALVQVRGDALDQGEDLRARERMGAQGSVPR